LALPAAAFSIGSVPDVGYFIVPSMRTN